MKFTLMTETDDGSVNLKSFESSNWYEALNEFMLLLRSNGFMVYDESVGINRKYHSPEIKGFPFVTRFNSAVPCSQPSAADTV